MTLSMRNRHGHIATQSPLVWLGIVMIAVGAIGGVVSSRLSVRDESEAYRYTITQSVDSAVHYYENSFFTQDPIQNTVYISDLVDTIDVTLDYRYAANKTADLTTTYSATALLSAQYSSTTDASATPADAWAKNEVLLPTESQSSQDATSKVSPTVTIPFQAYRSEVSQLTDNLGISLNGQVVVSFVVRTAGTVDGVAVNDTRTSTMTIPLSEAAFQAVASADDATDVTPDDSSATSGWWTTQRIMMALFGIAALGTGLVVFGLRRREGSTAYERELAKIMRYHEGVIVRATKPGDIADKQVVPISSFDDMLNLEEELRTPIVAVPAGPEATQFMILHEAVVYRYTLGKLPDDTEIAAAGRSLAASKRRHRP